VAAVGLTVLAVTAGWWAWRRLPAAPDETAPRREALVALAAALLVSATLAAVAGRFAGFGLASRIWTPALPFVATLGALVPLWAARARWQLGVALALVGTATVSAVSADQAQIARLRWIQAAARDAKPLLDPN